MKTRVKLWAIAILSLTLIACGGDDSNPADMAEAETIVDVANADGNFSTLIAALEATDLDDVLDDETSTFTVFAPTDAAFALLGEDTINALLADTETLSDILLYHVITGSQIDAAAAIDAAGTTVETANGDSIALSLDGETLLVNFSEVTVTDIQADNGIIHVIDAVLMPPADVGEPTQNIVEIAAADGRFTTLVAALQAASLDTLLADEDSNFTVFAPTDDAFAVMGGDNVTALLGDIDNLSAILLRHVVADAAVDSITALSLNGISVETAGGAQVPIAIIDDDLRVGGAKVLVTDIVATNGVIHVIDTVIVGEAGLPKPAENIAEVATAAGSFTTLLTALAATGLDMVLTDENGSFTVFAPTDDAFDELGAQTIADLLADTDTLSDILLYHVISGAEVLADGAISVAASDSSLVEMANMDKAALSLGDEGLVINLSGIQTANVMASNGVIHVVDKVLMPPAEVGTPIGNIVDTAIAAGNFTTLVSALQTAGLDDDLADENAEFTVFAPTDAAFDLIDAQTLNDLLADVPALTAVLSQHVIAGATVDSVTAFSLNGESVNTLGDEDISIQVDNGVLSVQGSAVSTFDIYTTNGVIHVIDAVITETLAD